LQLSHPHICALYDVGREGETEFLVMEYLEGETLSERLGNGALPLEQTLRYGIEIADALDKAHRQGIVHRDLKPGNVMLTKSGVKLLDFGLAKLAAPTGVMSGLSMLPTTPKASNLTAEGTILGTLQYMAPEQLEGKEADARTDIFAFGAVLYEMATGKKAFSGTSQASLIGAILKDEPALISTLQPMSPPALDRIIRTCLAKDPEDRWQSAHDVGSELKWIASTSSEARVPAPVVLRRKNRERVSWALLAAMTAAAISFAVGYFRRAPSQQSLIRFEIQPSGSDFGSLVDQYLFNPAVAPDGRRVAYVSGQEGKRAIWIRALDEVSPRPLAGTDDGSFPFWSPDGASIGFFAEGKLKRVAASGGPVQVICHASAGRGGTWGKDGTILFAGGPTSGIDRVSSAGGTASAVTRIDEAAGEASHRWPSFLPDGKHFLYLIYGSDSSKGKKAAEGIFLGSLDGKEKRLIRPEHSNAVYAEPGYLLFCRDQNLLAQRFDLRRLQTSGEPLAVAERVQYWIGTRNGLFSVSASGTLAYLALTAPPQSRLLWFDRSGREVGRLGDAGYFGSPRLSPDGRRVAVSKLESDFFRSSIWTMDTSRASSARVTDGSAIDDVPTWFPDGKQIAFESAGVPGPPQLFAVNEAGVTTRLRRSDTAENVNDISSDGRLLIYSAAERGKISRLWTMNPTGGDAPARLTTTKSSEAYGQFSSAGSLLAYISDESGKPELFVSPFPIVGEHLQVSPGGAGPPRWSRDGKELFYFKDGRKLMAVEVKTRPKLELGVPKMLFELRFPLSDGWQFDVAADGQRFLVNAPEGEQTAPPINVVLNWTALLRGK